MLFSTMVIDLTSAPPGSSCRTKEDELQSKATQPRDPHPMQVPLSMNSRLETLPTVVLSPPITVRVLVKCGRLVLSLWTPRTIQPASMTLARQLAVLDRVSLVVCVSVLTVAPAWDTQHLSVLLMAGTTTTEATDPLQTETFPPLVLQQVRPPCTVTLLTPPPHLRTSASTDGLWVMLFLTIKVTVPGRLQLIRPPTPPFSAAKPPAEELGPVLLAKSPPLRRWAPRQWPSFLVCILSLPSCRQGL